MNHNIITRKPEPAIDLRCSTVLRCLGQELERMDLKAVDVKAQGEDYVVQSWNKGTTGSMSRESRYHRNDIRKLEVAGRGRRKSQSGRRDLLSLPEVLRFAGNYVDRSGGRFVRVSWQAQSDKIQLITIQYEPGQDARNELSDATANLVEELCIQIYKQRKKLGAGSEKAMNRCHSNRGTAG